MDARQALGYRKIEEYAVIGNLETCALVAIGGSIDWCCFPYLESPSVFAATLDDEKGGRFVIRPSTAFESAFAYIPETNILKTHFIVPEGRLTLTDFMPIEGETDVTCRSILRRLFCIRGEVEIEAFFQPALDYAKQRPRLRRENGNLEAELGDACLSLQSPFPLEPADSGAYGRTTIREGQVLWFVLQYGKNHPVSPEVCEKVMKKTVHFWHGWSRSGSEDRLDFETSWRDLTVRSSLVLKLLTRPSTGGIAAAATMSLPEIVQGLRNWDYRYAWIRDAAFTVQALEDLGHQNEARDYFGWISSLSRAGQHPSEIRICYRLDGKPVPEEQNLDHLRGYRDSRPVRVGNKAVHQFQLDIFGELVNAVYETYLHGEHVSQSTLFLTHAMIDFVCEKWTEPDSGIWEMRKPPAHYTYSKLMCWVAIDRGLRLARQFSHPVRYAKWEETAAAIREAILQRGFNTRLNAFTQTLDGDDLDATGLLIPILGFLDAKDPRVLGTIDATMHHLARDGLVYRYRVDDGLPGEESPFVLCSFWLINALALAGRRHEAEALFEKIARRASPTGLYGEEIEPSSGEHRGNFPQAFSHIGLINSAFYLSRARRGEAVGPKSTQSMHRDTISK